MIYQPKPRLGRVLNKRHPLAKGLVGAWLMNEGAGDTVFDLSGRCNNGTINGADWVPKGLDFVAANSDWVDFATSPTYTDISFSTWIRRDAAQIGNLMKGAGIFTYVTVDEVTHKFSVYDGVSWRRAPGINLNAWNHLVFTFKGNIKELKIYVNGINGYSGTSGTYVNGNFTQFGKGNWYLNSKVANTYIYNRAISSSEILYLYHNPYAMFQPAISSALYSYETATGLTILDYERSIGRGIARGIGRGIA